MEIVIRDGSEKDLAPLLDLIREFATFQKSMHAVDNSLDRMLADFPSINFLLAEEAGGEMVGYLAYYHCYFTWSGKGIQMDDLFVKQSYRGAGIGSQLVDRLKSIAQDSGCRKLKWQVSWWNGEAIEFYKKLGVGVSSEEWNCQLILDSEK